ncbi:MAG: ribosome maturation factor RimM [Bacteroidales bacterium]|jgi:16S rRNA processing protein RimM|nr:ribosome maturation factor RimM [Bacteroidales bacterium]
MSFPLIENCNSVGYISKTYGGAGMVLIALKAIDSEAFAQRNYVLLDILHKLVPFFIEECVRKNNNVYLKFYDIHSVEDAEKIAGLRIYIEKTDDEEPDGETHELVSYTLYNAPHTEIGTIRTVHEYPMQLLLEVHTPTGSEVLIPLVEDLIESIDEEHHTITMRLPEGLLGLND